MKLILSKNQWQSIGIKTGWIKYKNIKISRLIWNYIGFKSGWNKKQYPYVYAKKINIFAVDTSNITDQQINSQITQSFFLPSNPNFLLISPSRIPLSNDEAKNILTESFVNLMNKIEAKDLKELISRYIINNKNMNIGTYLAHDKNELMLSPTFNYDALSHLKIPFSRYIQNKGLKIQDKSQERNNQPTVNAIPQMQNIPEEERGDILYILQEMMAIANAAGILSSRGKARIESVGNRTTNWDTGYGFTISGNEVDYLKNILGIFTQLSNEDMANTKARKHYSLTKRDEVSKLMGNLGLAEDFDKAVNQIKTLEINHNLKERVNELREEKQSLENPENSRSPQHLEKIKGRQKEYETNLAKLQQDVQEIPIDLSALKDKIFNHIYTFLIGKYRQQIEAEGINKEKIKHAMAASFEHGTPIGEQEINNLVEMAI